MTVTVKQNPYNHNIPELSLTGVYYEEMGDTVITLPSDGIDGVTYEIINDNEE